MDDQRCDVRVSPLVADPDLLEPLTLITPKKKCRTSGLSRQEVQVARRSLRALLNLKNSSRMVMSPMMEGTSDFADALAGLFGMALEGPQV